MDGRMTRDRTPRLRFAPELNGPDNFYLGIYTDLRLWFSGGDYENPRK